MGHLILGRMGNGFLDNIVGALIYWAAQFCGMSVASIICFVIFIYNDDPVISTGDEWLETRVCLFATCPGVPVDHGQMGEIRSNNPVSQKPVFICSCRENVP